MNRIDRLNAIMIHLQGKSRVPLEEMEERFEVSRRTLFRDVKSLMEAGVPIGGDAGSGYFVVEGYHLPPVVFNKEEAAALLTGAKLIAKHADADMVGAFDQAMHKVKAVLRMSDKDFLENLDSRVAILDSPARSKTPFPDSFLSEIQLALASQKVVELNYFSNYNESTTNRKVEPLGLVYYSGRWHLIGYCRLRSDLRDFRTDRIQKISITSETYDPTEHPNLQEFTKTIFGGTDVKEAVVRFKRRMARFISEQKLNYGFIDQVDLGEEIEMRFATPMYEILAQWLLSYIEEVTVVGPPTLQGLMAKYSQKLFEHHKKYFEVLVEK